MNKINTEKREKKFSNGKLLIFAAAMLLFIFSSVSLAEESSRLFTIDALLAGSSDENKAESTSENASERIDFSSENKDLFSLELSSQHYTLGEKAIIRID